MDRRSFLNLAAFGALSTTVGSLPVFARDPLDQATFTTWFPKDFDCPVCKTKNTFQVWASYGSYIYFWPSKYQWVFWPWTVSQSVYLCKKCHLSAFMDEFDKITKVEANLLTKELPKIKFGKTFKEYTDIPITERLEIAEKVYQIIGRKEDRFWNFLYRVKGYHYGKARQPEKATEARKKALELTTKMIGDSENKVALKELLYISGAMKHFLSDDKGAVADLRSGLATKFKSVEVPESDLAGAESGLNERFNDYLAQIASAKPPRMSDSVPD